MSNAFTASYFQSNEAARAQLEGWRWPNGPVCSHCGVIGRAYATKRAGLYRCAEPACRKDFTVTTRTVMERSKVPLNKWLMAFFMMASSKNGISAHQLHRSLGLPYQTAWFMAHRIRHAMSVGGLTATTTPEPMGGEGKIVEADETYFGKTAEPRPRRKYADPYTKGGKSGPSNKRPIVSLVERGGHVRSFHVPVATKAAVMDIVTTNIAKDSRLFTDESRLYGAAKGYFADHQTVKHSAGEYVRLDDRTIHSNTIEGYFSIFKRGMKGVYQHCAEKHLHRYLAEFDFRYNHRVGLGFSDVERTVAAVRAAEGKRLTYHQTH